VCFAVCLVVTFVLLVALVPDRTVSTAAQEEPIAHTAESRKIPQDTNVTKTAPLMTDESIEPQNEPFSVLGASSTDSAIQSSVGNWHIECVDCPKWFNRMGEGSLQLDDASLPHIAYGGEHLYYARYDGAQWHYEIVDEALNVGAYASLALDGLNWPHISYYDATHGNLKYAWRDETGWHIETVDSAPSDNSSHVWESRYASLVLDVTNQPHIIYPSDGLKYAWRDGTGWHIETVDSNAGASASPSLALGEAGEPHISYYDETNYDLKYASLALPVWADGRDGVQWQIETVYEEGGVGRHTSLALDQVGRPHISYLVESSLSASLGHAWHDGTTWYTEIVDSEGGGWYNSLALDGTGRLYVSYYYCKLAVLPSWDWICAVGDLKYARYDDTGWHVENVDSTGDVGRYTSLALDALGQPHIGYYGDGDSKYAWYDGKNWQVETVDSAADAGTYISSALDETSKPHISYYDSTQRDLKYAWFDGMDWHTETVDSVGSVGQYPSLALDGQGRPHISYYDATDGDLKYAWYDEIGWHIESVDSEGNVGGYTSLALDEMGRPHISYCSYAVVCAGHTCHWICNELRYAWHDGNT
jgi:hypothetical protein